MNHLQVFSPNYDSTLKPVLTQIDNVNRNNSFGIFL